MKENNVDFTGARRNVKGSARSETYPYNTLCFYRCMVIYQLVVDIAKRQAWLQMGLTVTMETQLVSTDLLCSISSSVFLILSSTLCSSAFGHVQIRDLTPWRPPCGSVWTRSDSGARDGTNSWIWPSRPTRQTQSVARRLWLNHRFPSERQKSWGMWRESSRASLRCRDAQRKCLFLRILIYSCLISCCWFCLFSVKAGPGPCPVALQEDPRTDLNEVKGHLEIALLEKHFLREYIVNLTCFKYIDKQMSKDCLFSLPHLKI